MTDTLQQDRDTQEAAFIKELHKRIAALTSITLKVPKLKNIRKILKKALDSMIHDGIIGPSFHQEVNTYVTIDRITGEIEISMGLIHPERNL
jgi:hypothetical protein